MALTRIISEIIQDNTVQDTDISSSFQASISGSFGNQRVGTTDDVQFNHITASGNISASGNLSSTGNLDIDGTSNLEGDVTLQSDLSVVDVNATNITGSEVSSSTALFTTATIDKIGGAIDFDNQNMTNVDIDSGVITGITDLVVADGGTGVSTLTDGGVLLGSGAGAITAMSVLADSEMIVGDGSTDPVAESGATLRTSIGVGTTDDVQFTNITGSEVSSSTALFTTATIDNIGAFKATGAIDFDNQNMTNVDIDSGVITGITDLTVADGGTGVSTLTDGGVLLGSGAGAITAMSVLTDGQMIVGDGSTDPVAESGATLRTSIGVGLTDDVVFSAVSGAAATFNSATINGLLTVEEIHTVFVSASVTVATGSNIFGDAITDIHQFTGSIDQSGSLSTVDITSDNLFSSNITGSIISGSTALLTTATIDNIGAFTAAGAIDFDNQNMTNVDIDSGVITGITDLVVADGGTGVSTLTDGGVLLGNGAGAIQAMAVLTDGQMIVGDGTTDPVAESGATLRTSIGVGTTDNVLFANITGSVFTGSLGKFTTVDINGGTIDGITSLTAGGDLDIGAHDFRAETITADGLTATRVPFAGTAGVLSDDADLTFATATLSATNLTTTGTIKNMALVSGSSTSTGSFGNVRIGDIGRSGKFYIAGDGTPYDSSAEYITLESEGDRSIDIRSQGQIRFFTDDANTHRVNINANGRVGIGTDNPDGDLDVRGDEGYVYFTSGLASGVQNLVFRSGSASIAGAGGTGTSEFWIAQMEFAPTGTSQIVTRTASSLALGVANTQRLTISGSNGAIRLGAAGADSSLTVLQGDNAAGAFQWSSGATNENLQFEYYEGNLAGIAFKEVIDTGGSQTWNRFNAAGDIIQTTSQNGDFLIQGTDGGNVLMLFYADRGDNNNDKYRIIAEDSGGGMKMGNFSSGAWVNTHEFYQSGQVLTHANNDESTYAFRIDNANTGNPGGLSVNFSGASPDNTTAWFFKGSDASDTDFTIFSNGTTAASSDERLKKDIVNTSIEGTNIIKKIIVRDWKWKYNDIPEVGFVAQELKKVYPRAVTGREDETYEDEEGVTKNRYMGVSKEQLIPVLVKAHQEAMVKIEALEKRIEELEN